MHWTLTAEASKQRIKADAFSFALVIFTQSQRPCGANRTEMVSEYSMDSMPQGPDSSKTIRRCQETFANVGILIAAIEREPKPTRSGFEYARMLFMPF